MYTRKRHIRDLGIVRRYSAVLDTPRTSILGFCLVLWLGFQLISGLAVSARMYESVEAPGLALYTHRLIPPIFVLCVLLHILRSFCSVGVVGAASWKSGLVVLVFLFLTCGTGYILASSGEAGYWGAVISAFNASVSVVSGVVDITPLIALFGVFVPSEVATLLAGFCGGTTTTASVFGTFFLVIHIFCASGLTWSALSHMATAHKKTTSGGVSARAGLKSSLFGVVESRDIRGSISVIFIAGICAFTCLWIARAGNGVLLNTELKPPVRVSTEPYFTEFYALFREYSLSSCAVLILVFWFVLAVVLAFPFDRDTKLTVVLCTILTSALFVWIGFLSSVVNSTAFFDLWCYQISKEHCLSLRGQGCAAFFSCVVDGSTPGTSLPCWYVRARQIALLYNERLCRYHRLVESPQTYTVEAYLQFVSERRDLLSRWHATLMDAEYWSKMYPASVGDYRIPEEMPEDTALFAAIRLDYSVIYEDEARQPGRIKLRPLSAVFASCTG